MIHSHCVLEEICEAPGIVLAKSGKTCVVVIRMTIKCTVCSSYHGFQSMVLN